MGAIDDKALALAQLMDGKLLLVTNTPAAEFESREVVRRYKSLADIERGFRALKSTIEIGPVHHRLADRIRAHALICFTALILLRVIRERLKTADSEHSPERVLEQLGRIQHHRVELDAKSMTGVCVISTDQSDMLAALQAPKPKESRQMLLL